jgi:hypothetical protein
MADQPRSPLPPTDGTSQRSLLSALTSWWAPATQAAPNPMLGYESAQPWMLADADAEADCPHHLRG